MFLRPTIRRKDGKEHRYWSVVESKRVAGGRVVQRPVLYLGEINSSQELAWRKSIEVLEEGSVRARTLWLFPEDRCEGVLALSQLRLERPRQWGACWLALRLWQELDLDRFWGERLAASRKGMRWDLVLFVLVAYRLIAPGSEWRHYREWYAKSALGDLLGADAALADIDILYRCHDRLIAHKQAVFDHLVGRWRDLFNASFDVLLYDLTSTYFEANPPFPEGDKRRFGYSRDRRGDCVQAVIALIVTPEGLPLAYEVLPGNTADSTTLKGFLASIERQYGKARLKRLEQDLLGKPWAEARPAEVAMGAARATLLDAAHARGAAHEARRRPRQGPDGLALGRGKVPRRGAAFTYRLDRDKLRQARRREGRYLLRTNLTEQDPAKLWTYYLQLVAVEEAFKNLEGDLAMRPIFHQHEARIEAHISSPSLPTACTSPSSAASPRSHPALPRPAAAKDHRSSQPHAAPPVVKTFRGWIVQNQSREYSTA